MNNMNNKMHIQMMMDNWCALSVVTVTESCILFTNDIHQDKCKQQIANSTLPEHTPCDCTTESPEHLAHNANEERERRELAEDKIGAEQRVESTGDPYQVLFKQVRICTSVLLVKATYQNIF